MNIYIFLLLLGGVVEINGCWKKSSKTTTTTTTLAPAIEAEIIKASDAKENQAWDGSKNWGATLGGSKSSSSGSSSGSFSGPVVGSNSGSAGGNVRTGGGRISASARSGVETSELKVLSEELYGLDKNSVGSQLSINYQGRTTGNDNNDVAPQPLFDNVNSKILNTGTIPLFVKLLDNYVADVRSREDYSGAEKMEVNAFLDAVMKTEVMKKVEEFLKKKALVSGDFQKELFQIWFNPYPRSKGVTGSSGFEHVFLGELKKGKVSGFHNWIFFQQQELEKELDYKGYMKTIDLGNTGEILKLRFDWLNKPKAISSMFIGTSPELEMALYTLCFYTRPNAGCNIRMNRQNFRIKVYKQAYQGNNFIGSAFPEVY